MRTWRLFFVPTLVVATTGLMACHAAPRVRPVEGGAVETGPNTTAAARRYLEGRWTLESFQIYPQGREPITLEGTGILTYDAFGNLDMEVRVDGATEDVLYAAGINMPDGVISTRGRPAVDMQNQTLTYVLEGQSAGTAPAGPLATSRPRHWEVDGNLLTLTTRYDNGDPASIARWKKTP